MNKPSHDFNASHLRTAIAGLREAWHATRRGSAEKLRDREIAYQWTSIMAQCVDLFDQHPHVIGVGFDKNPSDARMVTRAQLSPGSGEMLDMSLETSFFELSRTCTTLMRSTSSDSAGRDRWARASTQMFAGFDGLPETSDRWIRPQAMWALVFAVAGEEFRPLVHEVFLVGVLPSPTRPDVVKPRM